MPLHTICHFFYIYSVRRRTNGLFSTLYYFLCISCLTFRFLLLCYIFLSSFCHYILPFIFFVCPTSNTLSLMLFIFPPETVRYVLQHPYYIYVRLSIYFFCTRSNIRGFIPSRRVSHLF